MDWLKVYYIIVSVVFVNPSVIVLLRMASLSISCIDALENLLIIRMVL